MTFYISNANAIILCDALVDDIDAGAGAGTLKIYDDTGGVPADADASLGTAVLLATLTFSDPAFGDAADAAPGATATASAITDDSSADATGTAAFFRVLDSNLNVKMQGTVATSGGDLNLNVVSIVAGANVSVTSMTVTVPES